ncbi:hypothetical protein [Arthrobacter sp. B6]|uniref:hypothetical protein n=1 Tax=Arthrobacter sp. B6 TaxID=1570137 RepID=UPI00082B055F|nr:hypothetical protein [Arthrobacter sp. B6]
MDDEELAGIANALYALPLDEFIAARTAAAKEAAGTTEGLPAAVKALPKPSVAAWAVNMLAAHQPDILHQLNELGGRMRAAQSSLDAAGMRDLGRERRTLLAAAVDAACSVAEQHGRRISGAVATGVEETLRAVTADEGAAAAVQSGRLLQILSADGVDTVDLDGAVAVPGAVAAPRAAEPGLSPAPARGEETSAKKVSAVRDKAPKGRPATTADVPAAAASDKPRLQAVRQAPRPASPSALEKAQAAERVAAEAADEATRQAQERLEELEAAEADHKRLAHEAKELRARLKSTEEQLERTRKLKETVAAETKQAARAADKAQRSAMLAHERVLRLGNTRP